MPPTRAATDTSPMPVLRNGRGEHFAAVNVDDGEAGGDAQLAKQRLRVHQGLVK